MSWFEGTDNGRQKTRNHGYDVIVGGELFTDYSDHPRKFVTLNPKLKSTGAGRYQLLSRWWDAYRKQLGLVRTLFRKKSGRCGIAADCWACSYLWLIVVISVRQSTVAAISGLHCRALVMVSSSIRLTAWLQNSKKRAEWPRDYAWAESPRLSPLWLSASSSARQRSLIITVITPLLSKAQRDKKCQRTEVLANAANYWHADVSVMLLRSMQKYTIKELADAKAENDALRDDAAAGRRRLHISSSSSVREAHPSPPAWIMQPLTGRHRWTGLFHPQREADHYAKTTGRNPEVY